MAEEPKVEPMATGPTELKGEVKKDEIDVDALMSELTTLGKTTPESIKGMHTASKESGNLARMVGDLREEIQGLKASKSTPPASPDAYDDPSSVDLGALIRKELGTFWNEQQTAQNQAYQNTMQDLASVQGDEDYGIVKDVYEEHLKSPNVQMAINSGGSSYTKEYDRIVRRYYRGIAMRSKEALEQLTAKGAKVTPPHMESGSPSSPAVPESDEAKANLKKIAERSTGSDDDIDAMLNEFLPKGDTIFDTNT